MTRTEKLKLFRDRYGALPDLPSVVDGEGDIWKVARWAVGLVVAITLGSTVLWPIGRMLGWW